LGLTKTKPRLLIEAAGVFCFAGLGIIPAYPAGYEWIAGNRLMGDTVYFILI